MRVEIAFRHRLSLFRPPSGTLWSVMRANPVYGLIMFTSISLSRRIVQSMSESAPTDDNVVSDDIAWPPLPNTPSFGLTYATSLSETCQRFELTGKVERDATEPRCSWKLAVTEVAFRLAPSDRPPAPTIPPPSSSFHFLSADGGSAAIMSAGSVETRLPVQHLASPLLQAVPAQPGPPSHRTITPGMNAFDGYMFWPQPAHPRPGHVMPSQVGYGWGFPLPYRYPPHPTGP
jgi:hypothetical protein